MSTLNYGIREHSYKIAREHGVAGLTFDEVADKCGGDFEGYYPLLKKEGGVLMIIGLFDFSTWSADNFSDYFMPVVELYTKSGVVRRQVTHKYADTHTDSILGYV